MPDASGAAELQPKQLLSALRAFKKGDFSARLPGDLTGIAGEIAQNFNDIAELNEAMTREFQRLGTAVGKEGLIGERGKLPAAHGGWSTCIESVNALIGDLVQPTTEIARVIGAVAKGDLAQTMQTEIDGRPLKGEFLRIGKVVNTMVGQLSSFASEVTRVAREVGSEGKLGGQAKVKGVAGTWKDLTDNVNLMAANLTGQVRNIAEVTTAVANGDLSKKITVDVRGEILELKSTINTMVDQLNSFASEVTRVAREVGSDGKLGGQAQVRDVGGVWKDLTDNVNMMAANLTGQVRNIAEVTTAVANGDLSKQITVDVKGEILELKTTINTMVDQVNAFASEVTRVAREVGTEGKLGGQAQVRGVGGVWKDLTENVNLMAANLTGQVRNIADVSTAVANGDLTKKITVDVKGEILELKTTINTMVDQLNSFASEVTRVAREVGSEGKLGGQAQVRGVGGVWAGLTDNVNRMAANLTNQVRNIAEVTTAVANGNLSKKITVPVEGEILELKTTINIMVDQLNSFASEVTRVAREVGTEGKLSGQAQVRGVGGVWKDLTENVNLMAANLTGQVRNIADVTTAVANGDLTKKITVDVRGEILELKTTINTMVDQLNTFASEVTRVAREVGSEGKLGGQAQVKGVAGVWKDLTDNVNMMAANLTGQVRNLAEVVTAIANGDLKRKLAVDAKGEIAALANTINGMIETLATFADQVTNVAREVGIEGKLGGQARVPGAAGLWRDLTDNVNQLAANLTTQVRAIAEVATAVTKGDLTRSITVEALGEVASLKDNINEMIRNLRDTTLKNAEQDWLKTNLAKFTRMLQGERDLATVSNLILSELAPLVNAQHGVFYITSRDGDEPVLDLVASYAFAERKHLANRFALRQGLVGQCAYEKTRILLHNAPHDYVRISSGLGETPPLNIIVLPVLFEDEVKAVIELASIGRFSETHQSFLDQLMESIGIVLNTIAATMRTEGLLKQSQLLTSELQSQQEALKKTNDRLEQQAASLRASEDLLRSQQERLRQTNEELEEKAALLESQKKEVEDKNREVVFAKAALEEKAEQLALTSKYKSQFLANMSHELRTPLNSLLILSKLLTENGGGNLSDKQVEFARTINAAGLDLLTLINDILDLSKIESGTVSIDVDEVRVDHLRDYVERTFRQVADEKQLAFDIEIDRLLPASLRTDNKRLRQVLKNLLSNAFKFTETGGVTLNVQPIAAGKGERRLPGHAGNLVAFAVIDTGIGIAKDKHRIIFEAFQQADGTTSRKYGGTGLGLSISREIARLLGGAIEVESEPGKGSRFTLLLPLEPAPKSKEPFANGDVWRPSAAAEEPSDDRAALAADDRIVLIVEDDRKFASILLDVAHDKGFKGIIATAAADVLPLARRFRPDAMTLDIALPDGDGWFLLDQIKDDPELRHIPVTVISVSDERARGLEAGARNYLEKPVEREVLSATLSRTRAFIDRPLRRLLLIEDDEARRNSIMALIGEGDALVAAADTGEAALAAIAAQRFDCLVVDLDLPDMSGVDFIAAIRRNESLAPLPMAIYAPQPLLPDEAERLSPLADAVITRETARAERPLDETGRFLLRVMEALPADRRRVLIRFRRRKIALEGRKVLIIDDDVRNIFSMTSALERHGLEVSYAENGIEGLRKLRDLGDVDAVLVDIMMPEMDGYETIRAIRSLKAFWRLPIIAVTAKAMKGDRERCLAAGATDYLAKPVETEQLVSLLAAALDDGEAEDAERPTSDAPGTGA